jgi:hypothetical protein
MNVDILKQLIATLQALVALLMGQLAAKQAVMPTPVVASSTQSVAVSVIVGTTTENQALGAALTKADPTYFGGYDVFYFGDSLKFCVNAGGLLCSRQSAHPPYPDTTEADVTINGQDYPFVNNGNGFNMLDLTNILVPSTTYPYDLHVENGQYEYDYTGSITTLANFPAAGQTVSLIYP